jgi:hypothetical protein
MAALADEWGGAGKDIGLELWRIEKMVPVKQPEVRGCECIGESFLSLTRISSFA